jgi:hypothetical protein
VVFRTEEAKLRAITKEIIYYYIIGRPQLVGTTSVEHSERLSDRLRAEPVRRYFRPTVRVTNCAPVRRSPCALFKWAFAQPSRGGANQMGVIIRILQRLSHS